MRVRTEREREKERREKRVSFLGEREKPFLSIDAQKIAASALIRDPIFSQKIDGAPDNLEAFNFSTTRVARGFIERRAHTHALSLSFSARCPTIELRGRPPFVPIASTALSMLVVHCTS